MDYVLQCFGRKRRAAWTRAACATQSMDEHTAKATVEFVDTIYNAEKSGTELRQALNGFTLANNWTETFAEGVFEALRKAIEKARPMGEALRATYDKIVHLIEGIEGFARDHPIVFAIIALGILVLLSPWVIEALGFAEGGIIEDSFAACWQSKYAGLVPKGSLFSFFQRLGMKGFI